jgi:hypothetical protein
MTNGCICCTLRDDLLKEATALAEDGRFDPLLIESTGIREPLPVATTFDFRDEDGFSLADVARIDSMVTAVDAINLTADYGSHDFLAMRGESLGEGDTRTVVDLLVEQIEFADTIVLNKVADATPEQLERAWRFPGWIQELYGFKDHVPVLRRLPPPDDGGSSRGTARSAAAGLALCWSRVGLPPCRKRGSTRTTRRSSSFGRAWTSSTSSPPPIRSAAASSGGMPERESG